MDAVLESVVAGTRNGAATLGLERERGTIEPGRVLPGVGRASPGASR